MGEPLSDLLAVVGNEVVAFGQLLGVAHVEMAAGSAYGKGRPLYNRLAKCHLEELMHFTTPS
jgi:hypothetical protein